MKRKIGIFLGCGPEALTGSEGIIRLLVSILNTQNLGDKVVIALPSWSRKELAALLSEMRNINGNDIEVISTRKRNHFILAARDRISKLLDLLFKSRVSAKSANWNWARTFCNYVIALAVKNFFLFTGLAILATPFLGLYFIIKKARRLFSRVFARLLSKPISKLRVMLQAPLVNSKYSALAQLFYSSMRKNEFDGLIKKINCRDDIGVWYIPCGFWPEVKAIKKHKVISIPDIVFCEFPYAFFKNCEQFDNGFQKIRDTLQIDADFLCYSERVKSEHLVNPFQIKEDKVTVIKHGTTDLSIYLKNDAASVTSTALQILENFQQTVLKSHAYLDDFHFPSMKFIFYSSQVRPHKNILTLVKAYENLLRKRFINIKLIITGNPEHSASLNSYILSRRLQFDVISLCEVSNEVLAALNHLAICAVNPTLFEGGFPFTFSEAYSVGTPSVMSRIPVVLEESQDESLNSVMLFDPHDLEDMTNKIEWAIHHKQELLQLQKPLYEKFSARTWDHVAREYLDLFEKAALSR